MRKIFLVCVLFTIVLSQQPNTQLEFDEFCSEQMSLTSSDLFSDSLIGTLEEGNLFLNYELQKVQIEELGYELRSTGKFSAFKVQNDEQKYLHYASVALNVHSPSIHTLDSQVYDLEMHLVHKLIVGEEEQKSYAIVSLLFKSTDEETPFFANWNPSQSNTELLIELDKLFPEKNYNSLYYVSNSATAPCFSKVNWYVIQNEFKINQNDLKKFEKYHQQGFLQLRELNLEQHTPISPMLYSVPLSVSTYDIKSYEAAEQYQVSYLKITDDITKIDFLDEKAPEQNSNDIVIQVGGMELEIYSE